MVAPIGLRAGQVGKFDGEEQAATIGLSTWSEEGRTAFTGEEACTKTASGCLSDSRGSVRAN